MILQGSILLKIIKKNCKWLILFICLILLYFILLFVRSSEIKITENDFFPVIGYPMLNNSFVSILLYVYQFVFLIYISYIFFKSDFEHSLENIILRIDSKTWIMQKIIILIIFAITFKAFQFLIGYFYFWNKISCNLTYFLPSLIFSLLVVSFVSFNLNFSKKYNILLLPVEIIMYIYIFVNKNIIFSIFFIIIIFFCNIIFFKFKNVIDK